jgi:hypothetical protein
LLPKPSPVAAKTIVAKPIRAKSVATKPNVAHRGREPSNTEIIEGELTKSSGSAYDLLLDRSSGFKGQGRKYLLQTLSVHRRKECEPSDLCE